jgi:glycosyltransferase involved in cell wall biosynthesis
MKIGMIAPIGERVPPKKYGGTERVVYALTENLVRRGHDVTLFASGDSQTSAKLVSVVPNALREANNNNPYGVEHLSMLNIGIAYQMQHKFDIIHDHNVYFSLPTATLASTPVIMTMHGAITPEVKRYFEGLNNPYNPSFVTISHAQSLPIPDINFVGNVYHGLDMQHYPFSRDNDGYLLFVGRIHPEKGVEHAIEVAEYLNLPLVIAAKLDKPYIPYFKEKVEPRLNDKIQYIGEVDEERRNRLMSNALCLLHPVTWREPFGLVIIEAMACGCPVIAFRRGSIPEIIQHGKNGFIVEDTPEMIEYVTQINKIERRYCRKYALQNFNVDRMTDDYERIYQNVIEEKRKQEERATKESTPIRRQTIKATVE